MRAAALAAAALAAPCAGRRIFELDGAPPGWRRAGAAGGDDEVSLRIALRQAPDGLDWLDAQFRAVSDPDGSEYGRFLTPAEINARLAPTDADLAPLRDWFAAAGVADAGWHRRHGDSVVLRTTAAAAGRLFPGVAFHRWRHADGRAAVAAQGAAELPAAVAPLVDLVTGLAFFPTPRRAGRAALRNATAAAGAADRGTVGPSVLNALYDIDERWYPLSGASQGVVEFLGQAAYQPSWLADFFPKAGISAAPAAPKAIGAFSPGFDLEAQLDVEYLQAVGRGAETYYWSVDRWMYEWASDFFNAAAVPDVVSISYAWSEATSCTQPTGDANPTCSELGVDAKGYVARTNTEFQKIGARGTTIVVSSGDDGAPGNVGGKSCSAAQPLDPLFPAASPYVLTVGGTVLMKGGDAAAGGGCDGALAQYCGACAPCVLPPCISCERQCAICTQQTHADELRAAGCAAADEAAFCKRAPAPPVSPPPAPPAPSPPPPAPGPPVPPGKSDLCKKGGGCATSSHEAACSHGNGGGITTGGGFSNFAARPAWQSAEVAAYLKANAGTLPKAAHYNAAGRGFPDVSAVAHNYAVWMGLGYMYTDGTSCSAPVVAGILSVVNAQLAKAGGAKLGFVNPLLYKLAGEAGVYKDITEGDNKCSASCCGSQGYVAARGWDAATGLGTINATALVNAAVAHARARASPAR